MTGKAPTIDWSSDRRNGISSATGRLVVDGVRAAQVRPEASSKQQIAALLDLLDLHLTGADAGAPVAADRVRLRVPVLAAEARGALGTLVDALKVPLAIEVLEQRNGDQWSPANVGWDADDNSQYLTLGELLSRKRPVPTLVTDILGHSRLDSLRCYPMLSTRDAWSLRLEGLEVARVRNGTAKLGVGKDGKTGDRSAQRTAWLEATGRSSAVVTGNAVEAAGLIADFASKWHQEEPPSRRQDEHALESRILRGAAPVIVDGRHLDLVNTAAAGVNWGSQFPCKWGPEGRWRYLDALLRAGTTPWAVEMKVQGGAGVGQYYRHAVAQAVLYREFIRRATTVRPWFKDRDLDAALCEAAVVVPVLANPSQAKWRGSVQSLCAAFGVAFVEVEPKYALRRPD